MYRAVVFDFFDVIHRDPFNHWLRQNGLKRAGKLEETAKLFDLGEIDLEEHHARVSKASDKPVEGIRTSFNDISFIDSGMVALIKDLKKTYKIGLLSNSATEYIARIIDRHGLEPLFDFITISSEVGLAKPDPRIFEYTLDKLGVTAEEAVFIDDNPRNVQAAEGTGMTSFVYEDLKKLRKQLKESGLTV